MLDATTTACVATHYNASEQACGSRWAVCQTHPQAERWALANLTRQSFDAYLPLMAIQRRDRATPTIRHQVEVPLFAGYVFVAISSPFWAPIQHTRGISRLLMAGNQPHYLFPGVLEAVRATESVRRHLVAEKPYWAPGTPCSLATGVFSGLPAVVLDAEGHDEVRIGVMFLGQIRQVVVAPQSLVSRGEI